MVTGKEKGVSKLVTGKGVTKEKEGSQIWLRKQIGVSKMVTEENFILTGRVQFQDYEPP